MHWLDVMFGVPEKPAPVLPPEVLKRFLVVTKEYGHDDGEDFFDAELFVPHLADPQTLQIQAQGQRAPVMHYGPMGWLRFRWEMRKPSEVRHLRIDQRL